MSDEVSDLLSALREERLSLDEVARRFRERRWPRSAASTNPAMARLEDPEPFRPGSFDEVTAAYHRHQLSDGQYDALARAMAESLNAEDDAR
jgi:hypothetical protein